MKNKTYKFRIISIIIAAAFLCQFCFVSQFVTNGMAMQELRPLAMGERGRDKTVSGGIAMGEPSNSQNTIRKRLAREIRKIWGNSPNLDRRNGNEIATQLSRQNPQLFKEAEIYFGGATWVAQFASLLAKPAENHWSYGKFENPDEIEDFKELFHRLRANNEHWIIAIDGKSGKTTLWFAIQGKEVILGELLEEMEFVEGEKQLFDLHQAVIHDKNLPFDIQYGLKVSPEELKLWADKMAKRHGKFLRDLGINSADPAKVMMLIFANANDIDGFCKDFMKSVGERIIVYNANGSHRFVDKTLATDAEFPHFNIAKIEIIPSGDKRIIRIQYSKLGLSAAEVTTRISKKAIEGAEQGI